MQTEYDIGVERHKQALLMPQLMESGAILASAMLRALGEIWKVSHHSALNDCLEPTSCIKQLDLSPCILNVLDHPFVVQLQIFAVEH